MRLDRNFMRLRFAAVLGLLSGLILVPETASAAAVQETARAVMCLSTVSVALVIGLWLYEEKRRAVALLERKYQEAMGEKKQAVAILESIAEGLVVVNNKREVVRMNPAAERILAVTQQDRIGRPLLEQLRDEQLIWLVQGANEDREVVRSAKQDATTRVLRASHAVITDEDGRAIGMVAVLNDVTKQRELDQMKSQFVSTVSHELRTPLVAMEQAVTILRDEIAGPLSDEQRTFVNVAVRNLARLNAFLKEFEQRPGPGRTQPPPA